MLGKLLQERYQIVQILSAGGFCQTYLAQDISLPDHPNCLVKHMVTTSEYPEVQTFRRLFTREVEALLRLNKYDWVPQLLAHFEQNNQFYLVQEFIVGHSLSAELQPGQTWTESQVVELLQEVLRILEFVHKLGIIHRDIKPSNLLRRHQDGRLVFIDFGSVKQVGTQVVTNQGQTEWKLALGIPATIAIGTPGYMPAEQGRGRPRPNSDIYALGMIGIQALTGLNPTQLLEDSDTGEIIWQPQIQVSAPLASVLTKMVLYNFRERYESATEALQELQALHNHKARKREQAILKHSSIATQQQAMELFVPATTLVPQKVLEQKTILKKPSQDSIPHLRATKASNGFVPRPNKALLIGIATSFATVCALKVGSFFLRSPGSVFEVKKSPVALESKNQIVGSLDKTLIGHSDSVWFVAIDRNSQTLVSSSGDKTIKIWNLHTGELLRTLAGHSNQVLSVAISPDGQTLASSSWDQTIKIWNLPTGELLHTLSGHSKELWSVAISPDGKTLVSGSGDVNKIWNLRTRELQRTLSNHLDTVWSIAISPDGQTLASGSKDQTIKIWNLATGKLRRTLSGHSGRVRSVAISPDSQILASSSWDQTIKIWNLPTGKLLHTLKGHSAFVNCIAISPDGQVLASGSDDHTIKIWNLRSGKLLHTLKGHSNNVNSVAFDVGGKILVSGSADKTIKIWRL